LPFDARIRVAAALVDGVSIRATERLLGVHRDTIMRVGLTAGEACARLVDSLGMAAVCHGTESPACWLVWALGIPLTVGVAWLALRTLKRLFWVEGVVVLLRTGLGTAVARAGRAS